MQQQGLFPFLLLFLLKVNHLKPPLNLCYSSRPSERTEFDVVFVANDYVNNHPLVERVPDESVVAEQSTFELVSE